jgi:RNA polymerase sigma-70 factor, ECF subfamily
MTPDEKSPITDTLYAELRTIASRIFSAERSGHTLQPTAVVNEACMRLMSCGLPEVPRNQQLALASRALKQVLIDYSRAHNAEKRGGGAPKLSLDRDVLTADPTLIDFDSVRAALDKLRALNERQAEVTTLKLLGGMQMDDIAATLGISKRAAEGDWTVARAWLRREFAPALGAAQ